MLIGLTRKISRHDMVMTFALAVATLVLYLSTMAASPVVAASLRNASVKTPVSSVQALGKLEEGRTAYPGTQLPCPCMAVK
jgi:hypothetical protein